MSLTLYTNPMSRGRLARWALEETGAAYETKIVEYGPPMKCEEFRAINPMGKIPALDHDGTIVTETAAIAAYLADAFPDAKLAPPPASKLRGPYYRWLFFCAGPLEAAVTNRSLGVEVPPDKAAFCGYGTLALTLDVLEKAMNSGPFLLGDEFSMADLYLGGHLNFGMMFGTIEARPAFSEYTGRLMNRPAALRATALDDAAMKPAA